MNLPNKITISRILLIPLFIILLTIPFPWGEWSVNGIYYPMTHLVAFFIFAIAASTDWIDGYIARKYNLITNLGKFLDPLADKLLVSAAFILLVEMEQIAAWIVILIITREFAVTGLRLIAAGEGIVLAASRMGKLKTSSQLFAIGLLLLHNFPFAYINIPVDTILVYIALILTVWSGFDYFVKNWQVLGEQND